MKNKKTQKFISALLLIFVLMPTIVFFIPQKTSAQEEAIEIPAVPVSDKPVTFWTKLTKFFTAATSVTSASSAGFDAKQWAKVILENSLRSIARKTLAQMTQSTVTWINTGFHGKPLFVENPGSFFKDIAKSEIRNLVDKIGYNSVRQPFGKSTALNIISSYKSTFEQNAQYSLSKVTNDPLVIDRFRNDFSYGGWDGFLLTTQFPQNNYLGYTMMVADEQARVLSGTSTSKADTVKELLQQGQGFLSPQTCAINPKYNNLSNQFNKPNFKCTVKEEPPDDCSRFANALQNDDGTYISAAEQLRADKFNICNYGNRLKKFQYEQSCDKQKATWDETNSCVNPDGTSGLVNTTPGSVVGASIMKAITGPYDQTSLAAAMGNSLSAIFDALLNKFMSSGLNALTNKINGGGNNGNGNDDFNYNGQTLGTAPSTTATGGGFNWNGPDEIIVLSKFKSDVKNAIDNGKIEAKLIDVGAINDPGTSDLLRRAGILQVFENIWPKTQELDMCLPGPNIGWENRIDEEIQRTSTDTTTFDASRNLATPFKNWIANKMKIELPGSNSYISSVNSVKTINAQADELTKRESVITDTLIKLQSIQDELNTITVEPRPGSAGETTLIRLKQRYDSMLTDLSDSTTVTDAQNKLADANDKLTSLNTLLTRCTAERTVKGWANPGGVDSAFHNATTSSTEKIAFCSSYTNPPVSCDVVFKTDISDYKNNSSVPNFPIR